MEQEEFGTFAQRMFDLGLTFNIEFPKDEEGHLPSWSSFDRKIMEGVSSLPADIQLPARPTRSTHSVNSTLWIFVECLLKPVRGRPGHKACHFVPPGAIPTARWTPDVLMSDFSVPNPISGPDDAPVPQRLIIIGVLM